MADRFSYSLDSEGNPTADGRQGGNLQADLPETSCNTKRGLGINCIVFKYADADNAAEYALQI
ncbi:hypothetical protein Ami103574_01840 [Aminipila butyrica]|uniref:Uncharacterized protein n=1 Tax=Aminipila butyrica TaxID=433296 RepID=A0A858BVM2_9FIRM|nr:hypothetical protein [Aminipila butyrica]QIB68126.1 hypothetical protein Ami103574_01840 [Aminipila butyrica]